MNYNKTMEKFENYVRILLETMKWKKPDTIESELDFLNDIDKVSQQYGYKATGFGENENKRVIMFTKELG